MSTTHETQAEALALLDKLDALYSLTTRGEWDGENGDVTWADYPCEPGDDEEPGEEYLAVVGSGASDLIAECEDPSRGDIAECYAPDYRLGPRNNAAWISEAQNSYPSLATALRDAMARAEAAEARVRELEAERPRLVETAARLVKTECKSDIEANETPTYAAGPMNLIDEARIPLLAEVEAALAREAPKS